MIINYAINCFIQKNDNNKQWKCKGEIMEII